MGADDILRYLREEPFEPFRLFVSDGAHYDIRHPEMAIVSRRHVVVGIPKRQNTVPDELAMVSLMHVTRIEPINGKPKRTARRKKRP